MILALCFGLVCTGGRTIQTGLYCKGLLSDETFIREVRSLKAIDDNYPKTVLSLDTVARELPDGLMHMNVVEWQLG